MSEYTRVPGDFEFRNVASAYDSDLSAIMPSQQVCGLSLQSQYVYAGLTTESGATVILERKFIGSMSGGNYYLTNQSGSGVMELAEQSHRSAKGELVRDFEPKRRHWVSKGMLHDSSELPLDLELTDDNVSWSEGDALSLTGGRAASGVSFYAPMRDEPLMYMSQPYWVTGTVLGEKCEGPLFLDHLYFAHGLEWKEYRWYKDVQVSWNVFANKFEDGTVEFGHIVRGRQGWSAGVVVEGEEATSLCTDVGGDFVVNDDGYVTEGTYDCRSAGIWEFTGASDQTMGGFNNARWGGYRAQGGQTRRRDDDRKVINGFTWLESFAERIRTDGFLRA